MSIPAFSVSISRSSSPVSKRVMVSNGLANVFLPPTIETVTAASSLPFAQDKGMTIVYFRFT